MADLPLTRDILTSNGTIVRIDVVAPRVFRLRCTDGDDVPESPLNRYGMVTEPRLHGPATVQESDSAVHFKPAAATLAIDTTDGRPRLYDAQGGLDRKRVV